MVTMSLLLGLNMLNLQAHTDEYFARYKAGESPLTILESKGFVTPQAKKLCKQYGMEPTNENYMAIIRKIVDERDSK
jgi:hypothetical protein